VPLTRRTLLLGAGAGTAGVVFGFWGRFALGGTFEDHVAEQLAIDRGVAREMLAAMRDEVGFGEYEARATGFLVATTSPSSFVAPRSARRSAVDAFLGPLFAAAEGRPAAELAYAGLRKSIADRPCSVLLRP
jgi:hypothetical protein